MSIAGRLYSFILSVSIIFSINSFFSCKNYDLNTEIRQSDSLLAMIEQASQTLIIDNEFIRLRMDSMEKKLSLISKLDSNRMNDEFKLDIIRYRALLNNYRNFEISYEAITYDNQVHKNYCQDLKKKLLDNEITKKEFSMEYILKKGELENHLLRCVKLVKDMTGIEKMYQRINSRLSSFLIKESG
ncbi:MAG: hypothetical protein ISR55_11655 [Bacteroidetes bacterium]|nr:hypothetical protein [Bacteroidota bacterium]